MTESILISNLYSAKSEADLYLQNAECV